MLEVKGGDAVGLVVINTETEVVTNTVDWGVSRKLEITGDPAAGQCAPIAPSAPCRDCVPP